MDSNRSFTATSNKVGTFTQEDMRKNDVRIIDLQFLDLAGSVINWPPGSLLFWYFVEERKKFKKKGSQFK
jgi:hypothetical protein